jgi:hypothetical protein
MNSIQHGTAMLRDTIQIPITLRDLTKFSLSLLALTIGSRFFYQIYRNVAFIFGAACNVANFRKKQLVVFLEAEKL